jgi:hypothetical protein
MEWDEMKDGMANANWENGLSHGGASTGNYAHDFRIRGELAIDLRFAAHTLNARANAQGRNFKYQGVAGNYRPAKTRLLNPGEKDQLLIAVFDFAQRQNSAHLGQRFHYEHAGHDGGARKVTLKKRLVDAYLFDADNSFARRQLDDAINEQERITVR